MSQTAGLRTLLSEIDPAWLGGIDPRLLASARESRLGQRMLGRGLAAKEAAPLLAPSPKPEVARLAQQWPRVRLEPLVRNLGVLAFAPAIRAEIGREAVRRLKQTLENRYLLALDRKIWDGKVEPVVGARLSARLSEALQQTEPSAALLGMFARQGRRELRAWAGTRDAALASWVMLLYPPDDEGRPHLPAHAVDNLYSHHAAT